MVGGSHIGLSLVTINLLSETLPRPGWRQVLQFCTVTAATLGIHKTKKLVKMMKQLKMIKLLIMKLRSVFGSLENFGQP